MNTRWVNKDNVSPTAITLQRLIELAKNRSLYSRPNCLSAKYLMDEINHLEYETYTMVDKKEYDLIVNHDKEIQTNIALDLMRTKGYSVDLSQWSKEQQIEWEARVLSEGGNLCGI